MTTQGPRSSFFDLVKFNPESEKDRIVEFIKKEVVRQGYDGAVVGLSGGIDSALCAYLLTEALGKDKVVGVTLCEKHSWWKDHVHAQLVTEELGIEFIDYSITPILNLLGFYENIKDVDFKALHKEMLETDLYVEPPPLEYNTRLKLRARGFVLTHFAKLIHYAQCQTLHQSEILLGYFDPFGDAVGDIAPIHHLYKTEIFKLAEYMGVPQVVIDRPPMSGNMNKDGLWTDEEDMKMSFEECDYILILLERGYQPWQIQTMLFGRFPHCMRKVDSVYKTYEYAKVYHNIPTYLERCRRDLNDNSTKKG